MGHVDCEEVTCGARGLRYCSDRVFETTGHESRDSNTGEARRESS